MQGAKEPGATSATVNAVFILNTQKIVYNGVEMSPAAFESNCGHKGKNWKAAIKVADDTSLKDYMAALSITPGTQLTSQLPIWWRVRM